jgi:hypothetical protein
MPSVFHRIFLTFLAVFTVWLTTCSSARADYFVWQDPKSGLSLSFPDTWQLVSSADPDDIVTIAAPSGRAHASCRVRVNDDRRFVIYPNEYRSAVQKVDFSTAFWTKYLNEYNQPVLYEVHDGMGLGTYGIASYAVAGFNSAVQGPYMSRMALLAVSNYYDKNYVLECSAHRDAYPKWKDMFMSVAKSIEFRKQYNEATTGNYRNFLGDSHVILKGDKKGNYAVVP